MKKINIILIILLSCLNIDSYAQSKEPHLTNNSTSSNNLLVQQSITFIKKHALLIALIPTTIYYHTNIINFISDQPYISSFGFYLMIHYICDSISNYQQQQSLLDVIALLKKITLYLIISHGIKNHLHQKKLSSELFVDDHSFLDSITKDLPYSFEEVTLIALKSYQELKTSLQSLNIALTIESEEFVFLCHASSINVQSLLYLVQNNPELYKKIYNFETNPQDQLQPLLEHVTSEITHTFTELEHRLLALNVQSRSSS